MFTKYIIPVIAVIAVAGIGTALLNNNNQEPDTMVKEDAMKKDDAMDSTGSPQVMKKEDVMVKDDTMAKDDAMIKEDTMVKEDVTVKDDTMVKEDVMVKTAMYSSAAPNLKDGKEKVLFFHAAWCPSCRAGDTELLALNSSNSISIPVYKVDFDTSAELKKAYGVTMQHTFVKLDGAGNALETMNGPSKDEIAQFVQ